jgi:hypothetical protein
MTPKKDENETGDPRLVDRTERNAATSFRDHASGPASEAPANNGRPNDLEVREHKWALENSTFASRAKRAAKRTGAKEVESDDTENKSVRRAQTKKS